MAQQDFVAALLMDIDGVVSAVHPRGSAWGDEVVAGKVFGPILVSPTLCAGLDALAARHGVEAVWLTDWSREMRERLTPFPGRGWQDIHATDDRASVGWWKMAALERWLVDHPQLRAVAWCDDQLRGGRPEAAHKLFALHGIQGLLIAPKTSEGLTPKHLGRLSAWADVAAFTR